MSPVRGLVALIAALVKIYESRKFVNPHQTESTCATLRDWSMVIQRKNKVCVLDADLLDKVLQEFGSVLQTKWMSIQFDDSVDAIFAKGSTIVAIVYLHELSVNFKKIDDTLDSVLKQIDLIEKRLETALNDVVEYLSSQHINLMAGLQLMQLQTEIEKLSKNVATIPKLSGQFHKFSVRLSKIQQRLTLDV